MPLEVTADDVEASWYVFDMARLRGVEKMRAMRMALEEFASRHPGSEPPGVAVVAVSADGEALSRDELTDQVLRAFFGEDADAYRWIADDDDQTFYARLRAEFAPRRRWWHRLAWWRR